MQEADNLTERVRDDFLDEMVFYSILVSGSSVTRLGSGVGRKANTSYQKGIEISPVSPVWVQCPQDKSDHFVGEGEKEEDRLCVYKYMCVWVQETDN